MALSAIEITLSGPITSGQYQYVQKGYGPFACKAPILVLKPDCSLKRG
jgi:hypothetical protein